MPIGAMQDYTYESFTSSSRTSQFHLFAAGRTTGSPVGLVVQLHGDGAEEFGIPNGGTLAGYNQVAKSHNMMLLAPRSPDSTGTRTWWEDSYSSAWLVALVDHVRSVYTTIDPNKIWFVGYSGGAEVLTYYLLSDYSDRLGSGGCIMLAGGGASGLIMGKAPTAAFKTTQRLHWAVGANDTNDGSGFNAVAASQGGFDRYGTEGFTRRTREVIPGMDHFQSELEGPRVLGDQLALAYPRVEELWSRVPAGMQVSTSNSSATGVLVAAGDSAVGSAEGSHSSRGLKLTYLGPGAGATRVSWNVSTDGRYVLSLFFMLTEPVTQFEDIAGIRHGSGYMTTLAIGTDGKLIMMNATSAGQSAGRAPNPVPLNEWVRVDIAARKGTTTTNGYLGYSYWTNEGDTLAHQWESSAVNAGTANVAQVFVGRTTGRAQARAVNYGVVRGTALASGWMAPYDAGALPEVSINSETGIEPGMRVTLGPWARDPDGGTVTTSLKQTGGTPVAVQNDSYLAPSTLDGDLLEFTVTATKTNGVSATARGTHAVLPTTERVIRGDVQVPGYWLSPGD